MNWLVTGGCGFIGTNLVARLASEVGANVRVVDNLSVGSRDDLAGAAPDVTELEPDAILGAPRGVELVVADIRDPNTAMATARGVDAIVHLAGNTGVQPSLTDPVLDCTSNVIGTLNFLEAARRHGVRRFVFASSGGTVIGDAEPPIDEAMVPHPRSPYGASKSACEGYCSAYFHAFGVHTVALRFGNVYGPRSHHKNSVVARFLRQGLVGDPLVVFGDGHQSRDFIYVDDIVEAIHRAATVDGAGGEVFQIATSRETTVNEIARAIRSLLEEAGLRVEVRHGAPLDGEIRRNYSDTSKAAQQLGWHPSVSLDDGLKRTYDWLTDQRRT